MIDAPFGRTGGKSKSYQKLLDLFPDKPKYVEVFGGSGVVLLNKKRVKFEVFNDIEKGLVEFYKCIQDPKKMDEIIKRLELTVHSREFWNWVKDREQFLSDVDLAFAWYYRTRCSFGQQGRAFGRSTGEVNCDSKKLFNSLPGFQAVHNRLRGVMIECKSFREIMREFDDPNTLFYLDPPYMDTFKQAYKHRMSSAEHSDMLSMVAKGKGTYVVSGYASELYDSQSFWTDRYSWKQDVLVGGTYQGNDYGTAEEVVWVKD